MAPINEPGPPPMTASRSLRPSRSMTGFNAMLFLLCQIISNRFHDQLMIFLLRESRNRDRAYNTGIFDDDGKAATVRSIVTFRNQIRLFDAFAFAFKQLPHIKGTMSKAIDRSYLTPDPFIIIRRRSAQAGMEKLVRSTGNINGDRQISAACHFHQPAAQFPGNLF